MRKSFTGVLCLAPLLVFLTACGDEVGSRAPLTWPDVASDALGTITLIAILWIVFR